MAPDLVIGVEAGSDWWLSDLRSPAPRHEGTDPHDYRQHRTNDCRSPRTGGGHYASPATFWTVDVTALAAKQRVESTALPARNQPVVAKPERHRHGNHNQQDHSDGLERQALGFRH